MMSSSYLDFVRLIAAGDVDRVRQHLTRFPALAAISSETGATRRESSPFFLADIAHYSYAGDTPLHIAAAAFRREIAELLVAHGADCRARNRRGAEPLHYAADANRSDPAAQAETIAYLIAAGADPNAVDGSNVSPLHRAVRTRSVAAVLALVNGGADVRARNASGATPLHLAVQPTGRRGSGSPEAREQQAGIVSLLLERGARTSDRDGRGRSVSEAATSDRIRAMLEARPSDSDRARL